MPLQIRIFGVVLPNKEKIYIEFCLYDENRKYKTVFLLSGIVINVGNISDVKFEVLKLEWLVHDYDV